MTINQLSTKQNSHYNKPAVHRSEFKQPQKLAFKLGRINTSSKCIFNSTAFYLVGIDAINCPANQTHADTEACSPANQNPRSYSNHDVRQIRNHAATNSILSSQSKSMENIESILSSQSESTMVPLIRIITAKGLTSRHDV
jgi:hypothetical protein